MWIGPLLNYTEYPSLPRSEPAEPTLTATAFSSRCSNLEVKLSEFLEERAGEIACFHNILDRDAVIFLGGRASETIERNTGSNHQVVRLCALSEEVFAWAGFREQWQRLGREKKFRFVSAGFTFHTGRQGELRKPQMMRSEWVSRRSREFHSHIGHPHWQVDVLDTIRRSLRQKDAGFGNDSELGDNGHFEDVRQTDNVPRTLLNMPFERMHLASAAAWWQPQPVQIAHSPASVAELDRWIIGCIAYTRQELMRC